MKQILPYIPLIIITGLMMYSICIARTSNIIFSYDHYTALLPIASGIICNANWNFIKRVIKEKQTELCWKKYTTTLSETISLDYLVLRESNGKRLALWPRSADYILLPY